MSHEVKQAVFKALEGGRPLSAAEIESRVSGMLGEVSSSSVRSCLRLQAAKENGEIIKVGRGMYAFRSVPESYTYGNAVLLKGDALTLMAGLKPNSIQAIVTDPPYGLVEYSEKEQSKLRAGHGGVWRLPPSFDGHQRSPLPRFTTLTESDIENIRCFFYDFAKAAQRIVVPGANVLVASNPLVVHIVTTALQEGGLEPRGQVVRLVQTMRGGDRPKGREKDYPEVSVMPRSQYEPWIVMRKPIGKRTVALNLDEYGVGGWRRISDERPFGDVIKSSPTSSSERKIAPHPSLKPQALMRQLVRAALPTGEGTILDPFAGSGSTLAAAEAVGYHSLGIEIDDQYFDLASEVIPSLAELDARIVTEGFESLG